VAILVLRRLAKRADGRLDTFPCSRVDRGIRNHRAHLAETNEQRPMRFDILTADSFISTRHAEAWRVLEISDSYLSSLRCASLVAESRHAMLRSGFGGAATNHCVQLRNPTDICGKPECHLGSCGIRVLLGSRCFDLYLPRHDRGIVRRVLRPPGRHNGALHDWYWIQHKWQICPRTERAAVLRMHVVGV